MKERMVAVLTGTGDVATRCEPVPELCCAQVKIRVRASLISPGTEIAGISGRRAAPDPGAASQAFGYANSGDIIETRGDCRGMVPGMRVAAMGAGYARHETCSCVPVNLVAPIPDAVSYEQAAYACLAATALQSVRRSEPRLGEFGAVVGLGIVGNLAAQFYMLSGARVIGWERFPARVGMAGRCGLTNCVNPDAGDPLEATRSFAAPYGLDFANLAFGGDASNVVGLLAKCMKKSPDGHAMGRIVMVGGCTAAVRGGAAFGNLNFLISSRTGPGYRDERYEHGHDYPDALVGFTTRRNLEEIVSLMAEGRLVTGPMTTHRFPLERVGDAVELLIASPESTLGVILEMP